MDDELNPYEPPRAAPDRRAAATLHPRWVRVVFYVQLATVIGCALWSLHDIGQIQLPAGVVFLLSFCPLGAMAGPVAMLVVLAQVRDCTDGYKSGALVASLLLSLIQLFTMLPLVHKSAQKTGDHNSRLSQLQIFKG